MAERADRAVNEPPIPSTQRICAESLRVGEARPEALHEDVRAVHDAPQRLESVFGQRQRQRALRRVRREEEHARAVPERRAPVPCLVAGVGPLDLDHVGAERAQDLRTVGAGERRRDVHDPLPAKRQEPVVGHGPTLCKRCRSSGDADARPGGMGAARPAAGPHVAGLAWIGCCTPRRRRRFGPTKAASSRGGSRSRPRRLSSSTHATATPPRSCSTGSRPGRPPASCRRSRSPRVSIAASPSPACAAVVAADERRVPLGRLPAGSPAASRHLGWPHLRDAVPPAREPAAGVRSPLRDRSARCRDPGLPERDRGDRGRAALGRRRP